MIKSADVVADFLAEKNIRHVFGIIGSGNAQIFDAILRKGFTEIVCVHHEQSAVIAAGAYFRVTGQITAALVTTGAGATNAITGVVDLWADSLPCLILSGNENSKYTHRENPLRMWGVQGYDCLSMVQDVVKYTNRILDSHKTKSTLEEAFHITMVGRPGPVWIDIPMNIQAAPVDLTKLESFSPPAKVVNFEVLGQINSIEKACENVITLLQAAKRPVFWLGHGIRLADATALIEPLLKKTQVPSLFSWAGIDMISSEHPLNFGRAGVYGQRSSNFILQNCDLLITIGTRMAIPQIGYDLSELARAAKIVVVDRDKAEATKLGSRVELPICADARLFIETLISQLETQKTSNYTEWFKKCKMYREKYPLIEPIHEDKDGFINSYTFMEKLTSKLKPDHHVVTDMGTALLSGHQILQFKPGQRLLTSTGLGEMGYGLPGAIGVSFARDRGEVLCLNCDGGMMMNLQELQTIAHHRLPIKIVVFNNDGYLMIKNTQKALFNGRFSAVDKSSGVTCPDFSKLAQAFGFSNYRIRTWEDFEKYIPEFFAETGPSICEVFTHPEQLFVPKLSLVPNLDGSYVSPPLEDLSPLLPRKELEEMMTVGIHLKSKNLITEEMSHD